VILGTLAAIILVKVLQW